MQKFCLSFLILQGWFFSSSFCQKVEISVNPLRAISGAFKKKPKDSKEHSNNLLIYEHDNIKRGDLMGNGMKYFLSNILPSNDTNKINDIMKSRGYSFNMVIGDPINEDENSSLLLEVIQKCNESTLIFFLNNGANPNSRVVHKVPDPFGGGIRGVYYSPYPLLKAGFLMEQSKMEILLRYGASNSEVEKELQAFVFHPIGYRKPEFIKFVRDLYDGRVPKYALFYLIKFGEMDRITPELITEYVKSGADINWRGEDKDFYGNDISWTLLMHAIHKRVSFNSIKTIISNGADVNAGTARSSFDNSYYPITIACCQGNIELVKFLVEKGSNINVKGGCKDRSLSLLEIAQVTKNKELGDYLFSIGAN